MHSLRDSLSHFHLLPAHSLIHALTHLLPHSLTLSLSHSLLPYLLHFKLSHSNRHNKSSISTFSLSLSLALSLRLFLPRNFVSRHLLLFKLRIHFCVLSYPRVVFPLLILQFALLLNAYFSFLSNHLSTNLKFSLSIPTLFLPLSLYFLDQSFLYKLSLPTSSPTPPRFPHLRFLCSSLFTLSLCLHLITPILCPSLFNAYRPYDL